MSLLQIQCQQEATTRKAQRAHNLTQSPFIQLLIMSEHVRLASIRCVLQLHLFSLYSLQCQLEATTRNRFCSDGLGTAAMLLHKKRKAQAKATRLDHESITPCETDKKIKMSNSDELYFTISVCLAQT